MFKITNILNPLTGGSTTTEYERESGKSLAEHIDFAGECIVSCGQDVIKLPLGEIFPANGEEYRLLMVPEGGDNQTWRTIASVGMGAALMAIPGTQAAAWHGLWMGGFGKGAVAVMGSAMIAIFLKDKDKDSTALSQSYAWQYGSNYKAPYGTPMPIIYGKARVRPVLKNRYVTVEGDKQRLYALYGLAAHKVDEVSEDYAQRYIMGATYPYGTIVRTTEEILADESLDEPGKTYRCKNVDGSEYTFYTDTDHWEVWRGTASFYDDIIVNGRSIGDYNRDVKWETRPGLPEQTFIEDFDVTYNNFAQDIVLYLDAPEIIRKVMDLQYVSASNLLNWVAHTLYFLGEAHRIEDGKTTPSTGLNYIVWNPDVYTTRYLVVTSVSEGDYVIATLERPSGKKIWIAGIPSEGDWITPILPLSNIHNIELMFEFPYGLYGQPAGEKIVSGTCKLFAQYREYTAGDTEKWIDFDFTFANPDYTIPYGLFSAGAVVRKTSRAFNISVKAVGEYNQLNAAKTYEIRVVASSPSIVKLVNVATLVYGEENVEGDWPGFTYPGEPLLGIKALASGQISGDLDVQVDVERSQVWVYNTRYTTDRDGNASDGRWVLRAANNHAWAVYDILAQGHPDHPAYPTLNNDDAEAIYGCGIDKDRLDYESFRTWAENIGELDYELNSVFDTFMTAWDVILRICQEGRGMVYPVGTKIYAFTDKAEEVSQVFTMGNIHLDTFIQKYTDATQKVDVIEVTYWDAERNYEQTTLAVRTADWDSSTGLSVPLAITLYGTTDSDQAWSIARFLLMGNELLNNAISFGVDVDALAVLAGDVVEVQHDVLTTGSGGRITTVEHNELLNGSFETATIWSKWGTESWWPSSTTKAKYGTHSLHTYSSANNAGGQQTFTVKPDTEYTLSVWAYLTTYLIGTATIRAMTYDGSSYYNAYADTTLLNQWQLVSVTFTTASDQTEATVWLGGRGEAYFDGAIVNEGDTALDFMMGTVLTFDRTLTITSGQKYQLEIFHSDSTIETKNVTGGSDSDIIVWGDGDTTWNYVPAAYELYSFGVVGAHTKKYRVASIGRTNELMRTLTLVQYDETLYDSVVPSDDTPIINSDEVVSYKIAPTNIVDEDVADLLNLATNLRLSEVLTENDPTGRLKPAIVVVWDTVLGDPRGSWEVWFRDVDPSDLDWDGTWVDEGTYEAGIKVELDGKTYISLEDDNTSKPFSQ